MTPQVDFSVIGEDSSAGTSIQETELTGLEVTALEQGALQHELQRNKYALERLQAEIIDIRQGTNLRKKFSRQILRYLWVFSAFCAATILLTGFRYRNFALPVAVLTTLVGGTAASAFGLVSVVLGGLFNTRPRKKAKRKKRKAR